MSSPKASSEPAPPVIAEGKLERHGPWLFVVLGVAMIIVAAIGYLEPSVSIAFVAVGAGLMALGGLAARIEGTVKVGLQGFEVALRARQALLDRQQEVEATDPEEAKRIGEQVDELDNWFETYRRELSKRQYWLTPLEQAVLLQSTYDIAHRPTGRYRGGAIVPGVDTEESQPDTKPGSGAA
jgi:hypothetical protein